MDEQDQNFVAVMSTYIYLFSIQAESSTTARHSRAGYQENDKLYAHAAATNVSERYNVLTISLQLPCEKSDRGMYNTCREAVRGSFALAVRPLLLRCGQSRPSIQGFMYKQWCFWLHDEIGQGARRW